MFKIFARSAVVGLVPHAASGLGASVGSVLINAWLGVALLHMPARVFEVACCCCRLVSREALGCLRVSRLCLDDGAAAALGHAVLIGQKLHAGYIVHSIVHQNACRPLPPRDSGRADE